MEQPAMEQPAMEAASAKAGAGAEEEEARAGAAARDGVGAAAAAAGAEAGAGAAVDWYALSVSPSVHAASLPSHRVRSVLPLLPFMSLAAAKSMPFPGRYLRSSFSPKTL
jgi:hypothetical protein